MSLSLNRISVYMPHRLNDEELEAGFIVRTQVFEDIVHNLLSEKENSIPQHYLIVGQRGMGKTTLLRRLDLELRKNPECKHLVPLSFPEEQYNIDRFSKFWLNCLDALADTLETEGNKTIASEIDDAVKKLSAVTDEKELVEQAFQTLQLFTGRIKRRPVLLIDNLNQILDRQKDNEHWQLRNLISKPGAPILIGASAEPLKEHYSYQAPFYDSFQVLFLEKLSFEELQFLLRSLAEKTGQNELVNQLATHTARIKTLYALTGGNPRTAIILFQVFANGFSESVYQDLDSLLEAVTPLYKARFEELSQQLQVVVDAIALNWDPCQLEQLREITRLDNQQLSPQLKRLKEMGWITQTESFTGRGTAYEISERFFNVWYLMRRSSRRQKRELLCLTKFLESLYGEDIDKVAGAYLKDGVRDLHHVTYGLALAEATKDEQLKTQIRERALDNLMEQDVPYETMQQFEIPEKYRQTKVEEYYKKIRLGMEGGDIPEALDCIEKCKKLDEKDHVVWFCEGHINHYNRNNYLGAEQAYKKAIGLNKNFIFSWIGLGDLYQYHLKKYDDAENAYKKAIELDGNFGHAWYGLGNLYQDHLKKYDDAEEAYKKAIELGENYAHLWNVLGNLYQYHLTKYDDAEHAYKKAIELDENFSDPWNGLGNLYEDCLKKYDAAENAYKKAIELDVNSAYGWNGLGNLYQYHLRKYHDAEHAYKKAIELDQTTAGLRWNLGNLYQYQLKKYDDAEEAYKKAIELGENYAHLWNVLGNLYQCHLKKYDDAEQAYKKAIELDQTTAGLRWNLGNLYQYQLEKYDDAEELYKKAIELEGNLAYPLHELGNLYQYQLKRYDDAEEAYKKAIELDEHSASPWNGLGNLYQDFLEQYDEAVNAYKKALELAPEVIITKYNLLFLLRDKLGNLGEAMEYWKEIKNIETNEFKDTKHLHEAIFAYYDKNAGIAEENWKTALGIIGNELPDSTFDDWQRSAAIAVKLGYGKHLLGILVQTGHCKTIRPFYEAIKALDLGTERYLTSVAAEVREPAKQVFQFMKKYAGIETQDDAPRKKKK